MIHVNEYTFSALKGRQGYIRDVGSKFGLVRHILCQSSQHSVQLQSKLHAKHANARGSGQGMPAQENLRIDTLRSNLVAFFDSSVQCTIVHD